MISIDEATCTTCGICYEVCPDYVFAVTKTGGREIMSVRYPLQCCQCGHCLSLCPVQAITASFIFLNDFEALEPLDISPARLANLIVSRRSIRSFTSQQVPRKMLDHLLHAAMHAGTSSNGQSESFIVIQNRQFLTHLEKLVVDALWNAGLKHLGKDTGLVINYLKKKYGSDFVEKCRAYHGVITHRREDGTLHGDEKIGGMIFRNAPTLLVMHGEKNNSLTQTNSSLAIRTMELLALTMGLGTCWVGFLMAAAQKSKTIKRFLELPKNRSVSGALLIGHPRYTYHHKIPRRDRPVRWI
ncbi:MAG: nitroreductase family protein [Deltaproteobacteria bacterium]|nr:nitroreductase family protein [Deltaproteobacteria bacterium]